MDHLTVLGWFALTSLILAGATVNGFLGHGFSTLSVPLALALVAQRVLNPVLVLLEVALNTGAFLASRRSFPAVRLRVRPYALALVPGAVLGALVLRFAQPGPVRLATYALLLPLVLLQAFRRGAAGARQTRWAAPAGLATGVVYGLTTISGPLLSVFFHHQGYAKEDYRAAISFLRMVESWATALVYLALGLVTPATVRVAVPLLPVVLLGLLAGSLLLPWISQGAFCNFCVVFNCFAVSWGLSRALGTLWPLPGLAMQAGWVLVTAAAIATRLPSPYRFWRRHDLRPRPME
jgi:uncharacterized membrane protein YfcA